MLSAPRLIVALAVAAVLLFAVLSIPGRVAAPSGEPPGRPFVWAQDSVWKALEVKFRDVRESGCGAAEESISEEFARLEVFIAVLREAPARPDDVLWRHLENAMFRLGPIVAACPGYGRRFTSVYSRIRSLVKFRSRQWDPDDAAARETLYRLLYGGRAVVEQIYLQNPASGEALVMGVDEPSDTPSADVHGVRVHSGDILVSRGGAPTSALIARGNDYPGNFSHIALVHVDEGTRAVSIIEAHIEVGVAVSDIETYFRDRKLRVMLLRPRADLPVIVKDPQVPHRAASFVLEKVGRQHVPYDFKMNYVEHDELFCSEVASSAYESVGIPLWMGLSRLSSPGLRTWLASFGVEHFETQEPSDLEYDPQLVVVAEWRDPDVLFQDVVDNAVTDVMLERADQGEMLEFPWYQLPIGRVLKAYSATLNLFGAVGPVPEGMSASAALRHQAFTARHRGLAAQVTRSAEVFRQEKGYVPPYWELVRIAGEAVEAGR